MQTHSEIKQNDRISESDLAAKLTSVKDSDMAYLHAEYWIAILLQECAWEVKVGKNKVRECL